MSNKTEHAKLIRERVVILTGRHLIVGTLCYPGGIRFSDALNAPSLVRERPHLALVDVTVSGLDTGKQILRSRFLLVSRHQIEVLMPRSELIRSGLSPRGSPADEEVPAGGAGDDPAGGWDTGSDVPTLVRALQNPDGVVRRMAAETLGRLGGDAKDAIPGLLAAFKDADDQVRGHVAEALGNIEPTTKEVIAALRGGLKDDSEFVRRMAAGALGELGSASRPAVLDLSAALKDREEFVRRAAADALGKIGAQARPAAQALEAALNDSDVFVRHWAGMALKKIQGGK
jgi:HEAT repeat protein